MNNVFNDINHTDNIKADKKNPTFIGNITVTNNILPKQNTKSNLGNKNKNFKNLYLNQGNIVGNVNFTQTPTVNNDPLITNNSMNSIINDIDKSINSINSVISNNEEEGDEFESNINSGINSLESSLFDNINSQVSELNSEIDSIEISLSSHISFRVDELNHKSILCRI